MAGRLPFSKSKAADVARLGLPLGKRANRSNANWGHLGLEHFDGKEIGRSDRMKAALMALALRIWCAAPSHWSKAKAAK